MFHTLFTSIVDPRSMPIWNGTPPGFEASYGQAVPSIIPYTLPGGAPKSAVVVCPGGGYVGKADHEAEPIALWLNSLGIAAFVLDYRVAPYRHPIPLLDARRAIQMVRFHAAKFNVDPARVGMLGFSAGGHLTSTAGTHFEEYELPNRDAVSQMDFRPDGMILCYPVISFMQFGHRGSQDNLLGLNASLEQRQFLSNETQVTPRTSPSFLWHTADDEGVPVENSLFFAAALRAQQVPFELHVFPHGPHGLGLAPDNPSVSQWTALCAGWLRQMGFVK